MKFNMTASSISPKEHQKIVRDLAEEFCKEHYIPFESSIYNHLLRGGADHLSKWSAEVKNLQFQHYVIANKDRIYAIIFDFEENAALTELLLKS